MRRLGISFGSPACSGPVSSRSTISWSCTKWRRRPRAPEHPTHFDRCLIETYGLQLFKEAYPLERRRPEDREADDTWPRVYEKDLQELEVEWLNWLSLEHGPDEEAL